MFEVAIIGSRKFKSLIQIDILLDILIMQHGTEGLLIVSGTEPYKGRPNRDVDRYAISLARKYNIETKVLEPSMPNGYDASAYFRRNDKIISSVEKVFAFWDGSSKGTAYVIKECLRRRRNLEVIFDD